MPDPSQPPSESTRTPVALDPAYVRAILRLEAMPEYRSGTDKSWVEISIRQWREHYAKARRVR